MKRYYILVMLLAFALGCKKPYNPPSVKSPYNYLVVQGIINSGSDSTIINLSRTVNVSAASSVNPELHATLTVESDKIVSFPLTETTGGNYVSAGLNLDISAQYRLRIKTANNEQYLSDFVPVKVTPPIDSIGFNIVTAPDTAGIEIYANAHDASNNTRYYRWDYNEDWQFHAFYLDDYILDPGPGRVVVKRNTDQYTYFCYQRDISTSITLASTAKLANDILYQAPVAYIAASSEKIETRYSILLRQYALTPDAFNFWQSLKKNTEQLGSIFSATPSQNDGNIRNITNPDKPALGFISVGTVQSKRIYIDAARQLPHWIPTYPYICGYDTAYFRGAQALAPGSWTENVCVDCSNRGSLTPPAFWK